MKAIFFTWLLTFVLALPLQASADTVTFLGSGTGPGPVPVSASATFNFSGSTLTITLTNTSPSNSGQDVPGSTLSGLFWNSVSNQALTPVSATVPAGSSIIQSGTCSIGPCAGATNVGGEFGYLAASFTGGADRGISSSGYLGGPANFGGANLDNPAALNGINFGIVSSASGFNPNGGLASEPLIQNSVVFVLTGVTGLSSADISNVSFQYGTDITELNVPGGGKVPEPGSVALIGISLLGLLLTTRQHKQSA